MTDFIPIPLTGKRCIDCTRFLTEMELKYYEYRCESCEAKYAERVRLWKAGREDPELDKLFDTFKEAEAIDFEDLEDENGEQRPPSQETHH